MIYQQMLKILHKLLQVEVVADNASIKKLPAMHLNELKVEDNYDTVLVQYQLSVYAESEVEMREIFSKLQATNAFEMLEADVRSICTFRTLGTLKMDYKNHLFQGVKDIELQIIRTRVA